MPLFLQLVRCRSQWSGIVKIVANMCVNAIVAFISYLGEVGDGVIKVFLLDSYAVSHLHSPVVY